MTRAVPGAAGAVLMALALAGCPGEIDPALLNMQPLTFDATKISSDFSCNAGGCHDAQGSGAGFKMAPAGWESALVGGNPVAGMGSMCMTTGPYLDPGSNPATGLFLKKLTASPGCGV